MPDNLTRDALITQHRGVAVAVARRYFRLHPSRGRRHNFDMDDAISYGQIGVIKAIDDWDPAVGCPLVVYCWIIAYREVHKGWLTSLTIKVGAQHVEHRPQQRSLPGTAAKARAAMTIGLAGDMDGTFRDRRPAPPLEPDTREDLEAAIRSIPGEKRREVVRLRFWGGLKRCEVGEQLGISSERVRQLEEHALTLLHRRLAARHGKVVV